MSEKIFYWKRLIEPPKVVYFASVNESKSLINRPDRGKASLNPSFTVTIEIRSYSDHYKASLDLQGVS